MNEELKTYLDGMESRLSGKIESVVQASEDRTAALIAAEVGALHSEIRAVLDHGRKTGANVTTCIEMIARQSRWHDETDANTAELLMRVNAIEKRLLNLESGPGKAA